MAELLPPPAPADKRVAASVLLDKRTRYLVEIAAREHDCSLTKYMEQAITSFLEQDEFRNHGLWDDDPAIRMFLLVTARPDLLTEDERALWKRIRSDASLLDSNGAVDRHKLSAAWSRLQQKEEA